MRNRHITRFGSPLQPSGALYAVSDDDGLIQMELDIELAKLQARGVILPRRLRSQVKETVQQRRSDYRTEIARRGIPDNLVVFRFF